MARIPTAYSSAMISPRSRRLRTIASVLLFSLAVITVFGALILMPSLRRNVARYNGIKTQANALSAGKSIEEVHALHRIVLPGQKISMNRAAKSVRAQVLFMYAYWGVTILMLLTVIGCVWMDFREISRQYTDMKIRMLAAAAADAVDAEKRGGSGREDG